MHEFDTPYKFVNPYNFVPFGKDLTSGDKKDKREVYRGEVQKKLLSGWLEVSMSLKTPLIIPDGAHPKKERIDNSQKNGNKKDIIHMEYDFLRMKNPITKEEEPVVAGSSLRGLLRSSYEAVTNSCMPFLMNDKPVSQRVPLFAALSQRGLLQYTDGSWKLYSSIKEKEEVIIIPVYEIDGKFYTENLDKIKNNKENEDYEIMSHLNQIEAKVKGFQWKKKPIHYGMVIKKEQKGVSILYNNTPISKRRPLLKGYYMVNKKGEIIGGEEGKKTATEVRGKILQYNLPVNVTKVYHVAYLTKDVELKSWKGKAKENEEIYKKLKSALYRDGAKEKDNPNQFCNEALKEAFEIASNGGNNMVPVYYFRVKDEKGKEFFYLSGSAAGRIAQRRKWKEIMEGHTPCEDRLCPACLLFGTIRDGGMKGHIRVSDGFMKEPENPKFSKRTLSVLATPRSTAFEFYLEKPKGATYWNYDFYGISEGDGKTSHTNYYHLKQATPRGRKMYWHHTPSLGKEGKTNLNNTMECLEKGVFTFKVYFDQIHKEQLQDLIWVITLGDNRQESKLQYKIGHAKPLGYGSVKLTVEGGKIRTFKKEENGDFAYQLEDLIAHGIDIHKKIQTSFDLNSESVRSVLKICDASIKTGKVDYPRIKEGDPKIFQWFAENRTNPKRLKVLPQILDQDLALAAVTKKKYKK